MAKQKKTITLRRDSRNGQFVSKETVKRRPNTTVTERRKIRR